MVEEGLVEDLNYFRNLPVPKSSTFRRVDEVMSDTHLKLMLQKFSELDQEFILVMRYSSLNPADLWELEKSHFAVDDDPKSKTKIKMIKLRAKTKSPLEVHNQTLHIRIKDFIRPRWEKLENPADKIYGDVIKEDTEHKFTNNLSARWVAGYKRVFPGKKMKKLTILRHCFITEAILNKVEISTLKKWVGHSPSSTIIDWIYNHHTHTADEMR